LHAIIVHPTLVDPSCKKGEVVSELLVTGGGIGIRPGAVLGNTVAYTKGEIPRRAFELAEGALVRLLQQVHPDILGRNVIGRWVRCLEETQGGGRIRDKLAV
jgi:hypothetical protein